MIVPNYVAFIILLIGGLNWGLVGLFNFNLVEYISMKNKMVEKAIYILVLLSTIFLIISAAIYGGIILSETMRLL